MLANRIQTRWKVMAVLGELDVSSLSSLQCRCFQGEDLTKIKQK